MKPDEVRLEWGPNLLTFSTVEDALVFAREQGAETVPYWPVWWYPVAA